MRRRTRRLRVTKWAFVLAALIVAILDAATYRFRIARMIDALQAFAIHDGMIYYHGRSTRAAMWKDYYIRNFHIARLLEQDRAFHARAEADKAFQREVDLEYRRELAAATQPTDILEIERWHAMAYSQIYPRRMNLTFGSEDLGDRWQVVGFSSDRAWFPRPFWNSSKCTDYCDVSQSLYPDHSPVDATQSVEHRIDTVGVPIWMIAACPLLIAGFLAWRDRPFPRGCCQRCGYDLTGNTTGVCPECGAAIDGLA